MEWPKNIQVKPQNNHMLKESRSLVIFYASQAV